MDKMREEFERWAKPYGVLEGIGFDEQSGKYDWPEPQLLWQLWQHLYPMVEAAQKEARDIRREAHEAECRHRMERRQSAAGGER